MSTLVTDYQKERVQGYNSSPWQYVPPVLVATLDADGNVIIPTTEAGSGALPTKEAPRTKALEPYYRNYETTELASTAWEEITAETTAKVTRLHIFDSSGYFVRIGIGAIGSEEELFRVAPGGDGQVVLEIQVGSRLTIRYMADTLVSGELLINFLT